MTAKSVLFGLLAFLVILAGLFAPGVLAAAHSALGISIVQAQGKLTSTLPTIAPENEDDEDQEQQKRDGWKHEFPPAKCPLPHLVWFFRERITKSAEDLLDLCTGFIIICGKSASERS